ncbi:MAG: phage holin family protein [bacterium]|nr:phage holin family protein [bacterium]
MLKKFATIRMMKKLLSQIVAAIIGLWLAASFVPGVIVNLYPESNLFGVSLTDQWQIFLVLGVILGLINFFVKPVVKALTLPLRILSLGIFSLVISMSMIWLLDIMFNEVYVPLWLPLLWTTLIIFALNLVIQKLIIKEK